MALAFRDIEPQAPTHVLVIPKVHRPTLAELAETHPDDALAVLRLARAGRVEPRVSATAIGWSPTTARRRSRPSSTPICTSSAAASYLAARLTAQSACNAVKWANSVGRGHANP